MKTFAGLPICDDHVRTNDYVCYVVTVSDALRSRILQIQPHVQALCVEWIEDWWDQDLKVYNGVPVLPPDVVMSKNNPLDIYAANEDCEEPPRCHQKLAVGPTGFLFAWEHPDDPRQTCETSTIPIKEIL